MVRTVKWIKKKIRTYGYICVNKRKRKKCEEENYGKNHG